MILETMRAVVSRMATSLALSFVPESSSMEECSEGSLKAVERVMIVSLVPMGSCYRPPS